MKTPTTTDTLVLKHPIYSLGKKPILKTNSIKNNSDQILAQISYGRQAIEKLIKDLENIEKQKNSLRNLTDLLHAPENVSQALTLHVIPTLIGFCNHPNQFHVQKATESLKLVSSYAIGREAILREDLSKLLFVLEGEDNISKGNLHQMFSNMSLLPSGVKNAFSIGLIRLILRKLVSEVDYQIYMMETCYNCLKLGSVENNHSIAIECGALEIFTIVANQSTKSSIQEMACKCIMMICTYDEFKKLAVTTNTFDVVLNLLSNSVSEVRAAAAGAIMMISIVVEGKKLLVREKGWRLLLNLIDDENPIVRLNSIKALTNCAEDYRGRYLLLNSLEKLREIHENTVDRRLSEAAKKAIEVISWKP